MAKFTVDTHLFRELGELLVGRDSTALVELIKNSYDADATRVIVHGEALDNQERGHIRVADDGVGMSSEQFQDGFLRIASRAKEEGDRRSLRYKRRFTGEKGIGRLAAHKLARIVQVHSIPWSAHANGDNDALTARIDWDVIESKQTLDELDDQSVEVSVEPGGKTAVAGTSITLRKLRKRWTQVQLGRFLGEVQAFSPPEILSGALPKKVAPELLLFQQPTVRDNNANDPGFRVQLEGEFASGDEYWQTLLSAVHWILEISARPGQERVKYSVSPTAVTRRDNPSIRAQTFNVEHPDKAKGPFFQARILIREGAARGAAAEREWSRRSAGVRVYMEGFRVLPYGEPKDDWLSLDADYARRGRSLQWLEDDDQTEQSIDKDEGLLILPNRQYFGAIFLTQKDAPNLQMLVNREGFVPDTSFESLVEIVRRGIDLTTRVRAAARSEARKTRKEKRSYVKLEGTIVEGKPGAGRASAALKDSLTKATTLTVQAKQLLSEGSLTEASQKLENALTEIRETSDLSEDLVSEMPMIRVLASIGTQMAAFVHEVRGLLGMAEAIDTALERLRKSAAIPGAFKAELARLHSALGDLRRNLERQASYLVDVVTPDARRRRSRQNLADRFEASRRLVEHLAEKRSIQIVNDIGHDLQSPPMFSAELTTAYANLLTNAVKAAGKNGRIRAVANHASDGAVRIVIENTGRKVDPSNGEKWFRPFESTTTNTDPVLGQGMGMGLPITRSMLEEYDADIRFVTPTRGYATAIQITFRS